MPINFDNLSHLNENSTHIWTINFEVDEDIMNSHLQILSEDEKERANRFRFLKDKRCFVITRAVLRYLSSHYLNIKVEDIEFIYETYGKPQYKYETNLKFNVSHSGSLAVIAFAYHHTLGIDIEKIKNDFDTFEIASNFFSKTEINALKEIPKDEQYIGFYRCWTRKEAFIKAKGSGLSFPLDTFSVSLDKDNEAALLETQWNPLEKDTWQLYSFIPEGGYIAALIVDTPLKSIDYFDWKFG